MKSISIAFVAAVLVLAGTSSAEVTGDYVEARSASVFTGACHFNGELVTTGREAIMAWDIEQGAHGDVDLSGIRAIAIVSSDQNLSDLNAPRKTELLIDASASRQQADAVVGMLREKLAGSLGTIASVRRTPIAFNREDERFSVSAGEVVKLDIQAMPNGECCKQPNNVWYTPLTQLTKQRVGYTAIAKYAGGAAGDAWERSDENSAFYGRFTL